MREASQRRMMQDVPKADVIITNPTHLSVAISYDSETAKAPVVLAKGEDYLAMKTSERLQKENQIENCRKQTTCKNTLCDGRCRTGDSAGTLSGSCRSVSNGISYEKPELIKTEGGK